MTETSYTGALQHSSQDTWPVLLRKRSFKYRFLINLRLSFTRHMWPVGTTVDSAALVHPHLTVDPVVSQPSLGIPIRARKPHQIVVSPSSRPPGGTSLPEEVMSSSFQDRGRAGNYFLEICGPFTMRLGALHVGSRGTRAPPSCGEGDGSIL